MIERDFDPDHATPAELRAEVLRLQGENEALRDAMGIFEAGELQRTLKLPTMLARLLALLSTGRPVSLNQIQQVLWFDAGGDIPSTNIISVHISRLRRALDKRHYEIKVVWGAGYVLSRGAERIRAILDAAFAEVPTPPPVTGTCAERALAFLRGLADERGCAAAPVSELREAIALRQPVGAVLAQLAREHKLTILHRPDLQDAHAEFRVRLSRPALLSAA